MNDLVVESEGGASGTFDRRSSSVRLGTAYEVTLGNGRETFTGSDNFTPTDVEVYAVFKQ